MPIMCPSLFFLGAGAIAVNKTDKNTCLNGAYTPVRGR